MRCLSAVVLGAAIAVSAAAEAGSVRLKSGEVLIGEIKSASFEQVEIATIFPEEGSRKIDADKIEAASLYEALAARLDPNDITARLRLAKLCLDNDLFVYALSEIKRAQGLAPERRAELEGMKQRARESAARSALEAAKNEFALERFQAARMRITALTKEFGDTAAAEEARALLKKLPSTRAREDGKAHGKFKSIEAARKRLRKAVALLDRADERTGKLERHFRLGKDDERLLKTAIQYYQRAFALVRQPALQTTEDEELNSALSKQYLRARGRLTRAYLELGTLYLGRGAINAAEECCLRACEIEPEGRELHDLHERIIRARQSQRFGYP